MFLYEQLELFTPVAPKNQLLQDFTFYQTSLGQGLVLYCFCPKMYVKSKRLPSVSLTLLPLGTTRTDWNGNFQEY